MFYILSDSADPAIRSAGYEYVKVDVHAPVLNLTGLEIFHPSESGARRRNRRLSRAVIQGTIESQRRDYERVLKDLTQALHGALSPCTLF